MNSLKFLTILGLSSLTLTQGLPVWASPSSLIALKFPNTSDRGAPVTTTGGGTRSPGSCIQAAEQSALSVNALAPNFSNTVTTASRRPNLYFYLPPNTAQWGEIQITDEGENVVAQTQFALPKTSGIIKVATPPTQPLAADKYYQWSLTLVCDTKARDQDFSVSGTLEIKVPQGKLPANASSLEQAEFYAQQSIWLDTLDSLMALQSPNAQGTPPSPEWEELLQSVGLQDLSRQPLLDCCQADQGVSHRSVPSP